MTRKVKLRYCNSCIVYFINASVFIVINEEKLVALVVYSLLRGVATISFWRISVSTGSANQSHSSSAQFMSEYGFTPDSG